MRVGLIASVTTLLGVGCGDAECIYYPCPLPTAVILSVSAANAPAGIAGLTVTGAGLTSGSWPCAQGALRTCSVMGRAATYALTVSAPGYTTSQLSVTVTGTDAGCNTCGSVDTQRVNVVLTPSAGA